jgi:predicted DNA-binding protein
MKEELIAVNCRIEKSLYEKMSSLTAITQKSAAAFVSNAIGEYISQCTQENYTPSKSMEIDRFAYRLTIKEEEEAK